MLIERLKSSQNQHVQRSENKAVQGETTSSSAKAKTGSVVQRQLSTLSQWSVQADVAQQLAKTQQAEQQLRQLYQQLDQLKRQLEQPKNTQQKQQLSQELQRLEQELKHKNSAVTPELQLASAPMPEKKWQLHQKIDLLTPRAQAENVRVQLANAQQVQLNFQANQTAEQSLQMLQQGFMSQGIEVTKQGQALVFSSQNQPELLQQPWVVQGEGIRLAAGNPIQIKLQPATTPLSELASQAKHQDNQKAYQAEIAQVQSKLQALMREVQADRQLLLHKLNALQQVKSDIQAEQVQAVSQEIKFQMEVGGTSAVSAVLAQGQITRGLVEFALAD